MTISPLVASKTAGQRNFLLGCRRADLLAFALVLLLMMLFGYRLRVYYRSPSPSLEISRHD